MRTPLLRALFVLSALPGCAEPSAPSGTETGVAATAPPADEAPPPAGAATSEAAAAPVAPAKRKIIYTAELDLIVEDFDAAAGRVEALVKAHGGYLAEMNVSGSPGVSRSGTWRARVPVERFDDFLAAVAALGELRRRHTGSQDVTEEFYDLEARLKNKRVEEARLLKHLEDSTGELKEILDVERELSRVREEIERQQGRLQLLSNLTALTTVTITLHERRGYVPPAAPPFGTTVARTFWRSVDALRTFGQNLVLVVVAVVPWLPVLAVVAGAAGWILRRASRRRAPREPGAVAR